MTSNLAIVKEYAISDSRAVLIKPLVKRFPLLTFPRRKGILKHHRNIRVAQHLCHEGNTVKMRQAKLAWHLCHNNHLSNLRQTIFGIELTPWTNELTIV